MKKLLLIATLASALLAGCATTEKPSETAFWPPLPQSPKLQFLTSISTEDDIGKKSSGVTQWLVGGRSVGRQIARPHEIRTGKGKLFILDRTYRKVLVVDLVKKEFSLVQEDREGALGDPLGLWVTEDETKYIADAGRKQIVVFDRDNKFVRHYGSKGQFDKPTAVAVQGDRVYVVDFDKSAVIVVDRASGKTVQTIDGRGDEDGQFNRPTHIALGANGDIYVNDSFNFRIQRFDAQGKFVQKYGYQGDTLGGFARPKGLAVDATGYVYVVDAAFENTQIFDGKSTDLVLFFGGYGPHKGSMYLPGPVHIDAENIEHFRPFIDKDFKVSYLVFVGNLLGQHKVNVYGFGEWIGPPLPAFTPTKLPASEAAPVPKAR